LEVIFVFSDVEFGWLLSTLSIFVLPNELRDASEFFGFVVLVKVVSPAVVRKIEERFDALTVVSF